MSGDPLYLESLEDRILRTEGVQQDLVSRVTEVAVKQDYTNSSLTNIMSNIDEMRQESRDRGEKLLAKLDEHGQRLLPLEADLKARTAQRAERLDTQKKLGVGVALTALGALVTKIVAWLAGGH